MKYSTKFKSLFIICLSIFICLTVGFGIANAEPTHYDKLCPVCKDSFKRLKHGAILHHSRRRFDIQHVKQNGKTYTMYTCTNGHNFFVAIEDGSIEYNLPIEKVKYY